MNIHLAEETVTRGAHLERCKAVVIMIHGRNQTTEYVLDLVDRINLSQVHYIAPQAADNSWYPTGFMAAIEQNEPYLSYALEAYDYRVKELLDSGIPSSKIVLLGFSQGACLTAEYASRNPRRYGGIVIYTGGLIGPAGTEWFNGQSFDGTPVFVGSSDVDEWVPESRVHETAEMFEKMGAKTTKRIYSGMDHIINDDEIAHARKIIKQVSQLTCKDC